MSAAPPTGARASDEPARPPDDIENARSRDGVRQRLDARALITSKAAASGGPAAATLDRLEQHGSAKVRLPRSSPGTLSAVTLNTAGGLTGDDRIVWEARAGAHSRLSVASAACEKVYRTHGPPAHQATRLAVGANARLDWLPQETIVFDGARVHRTLEATLARGARLLVAEALVLGRRASGETLGRIEVHDRWRVRGADGRLLHAEALRLGDDGDWPTTTRRRGVLAGCGALATVLYCDDGPHESLARLANELHALIDASIDTSGAETVGGASALAGRLVVRLVAPTGFELRRTLLPCLARLLDGAPIPQVWHV